MLRIAIVERVGGSITMRLEGRVIGPWVEELKRLCEPFLAGGASLTLDLAEVSFIGRDGMELFRTLTDHDAVLLNCSPFVGEQLKTIRAPREGVDHGG